MSIDFAMCVFYLNTSEECQASQRSKPRWRRGLEIYCCLMVRLHVRKKGPLAVRFFVVIWATRAFALVLVILVDDESSPHLLAAGMIVGLQMFVELGVGVDRVLLLKRHGAIEPTLNARQVCCCGVTAKRLSRPHLTPRASSREIHVAWT